MANIIFLVVLFLANAVQAITGFAGTVLAMPPSILLIGMDEAKVVLNAMAWLSGLIIAVQNCKDINFKELGKMIALMFIGMIIGMKVYEILPANQLLIIYGVVVILIGLKDLCIKKTFQLNKVICLLILLAAGVMHGMFVSGGALLVIYAVQALKDKNEFRATVAPIWVILNTFMMFSYMRGGLVSEASLQLIGVSIIPLFLAIWIGNKLQKKINQKVFLNLTYGLLMISGLSIII